MVNPLHLELLSEGTETWNSWIHSHPYVVADFSEANLEHLHLDNTHLISANFIGTNLSHATFQGADLREAFFRGTWLQGGHFSKAVFR
jgi:uncharacterized protein YjbI with pentapeptide repeats